MKTQRDSERFASLSDQEEGERPEPGKEDEGRPEGILGQGWESLSPQGGKAFSQFNLLNLNKEIYREE